MGRGGRSVGRRDLGVTGRCRGIVSLICCSLDVVQALILSCALWTFLLGPLLLPHARRSLPAQVMCALLPLRGGGGDHFLLPLRLHRLFVRGQLQLGARRLAAAAEGGYSPQSTIVTENQIKRAQASGLENRLRFFYIPPCQHPELAERVSVDLVVFRRGVDVVRPRRPPPPTQAGALLQLCLDTPEISIILCLAVMLMLLLGSFPKSYEIKIQEGRVKEN